MSGSNLRSDLCLIHAIYELGIQPAGAGGVTGQIIPRRKFGELTVRTATTAKKIPLAADKLSPTIATRRLSSVRVRLMMPATIPMGTLKTTTKGIMHMTGGNKPPRKYDA